MDWDDLRYFLAVDRSGSVRKAADRLQCSHSTVSRRLEALEYRLKARLFDRTPDGFVLTDAGAAIVAKATQIEAEMLDLQRSISGADVRLEGPIRLTLPPPIAEHLILPIVDHFCERHPAIEIEIVSTYAFSDLTRRDADIAIRFSQQPSDHLIGRRLPAFMESVFASPDYVGRIESEPSLTPSWIGWSNAAAFKRRIAQTSYARAPVKWIMPDLNLQTAAARKGLGIALLPCLIGDNDPLLKRIPGAPLSEGLPAWVLTHPDLRRMERVRIFSQFLVENIVAQKAIFAGTAVAT
jgi:DNA-binding transcriptional LysR family regulator